jgi:hypothetical protein
LGEVGLTIDRGIGVIWPSLSESSISNPGDPAMTPSLFTPGVLTALHD